MAKNTQKASLILNKQLPLRTAHVCVHVILHNCRTQHSTEQNSLDNLPSHPPDNHHCPGDVYWSLEGRGTIYQSNTSLYAAQRAGVTETTRKQEQPQVQWWLNKGHGQWVISLVWVNVLSYLQFFDTVA